MRHKARLVGISDVHEAEIGVLSSSLSAKHRKSTFDLYFIAVARFGDKCHAITQALTSHFLYAQCIVHNTQSFVL